MNKERKLYRSRSNKIICGVMGGLGYYFKIYKPKHELDDADDLDMFPFDGPEEPTVREEALLTEEEDAERRRQYEEGWDDDEGDADAPVQ